jgi:glycosyltransferase involved in cell wall biosynthesis
MTSSTAPQAEDPGRHPRILVYSSLFPFPKDPTAGVFIRERLFRVGRHLPIAVVSPKAWSPVDGLIRWFRPRFRPVAPKVEVQQGITVYAPRFFSLPGLFKAWDSTFMALGSYFTLRRLKHEFGFEHIDAHFGYPDGHAAGLLARWFNVPLTITLRGSEKTYAENPAFRKRIVAGLNQASKVIGVSDSLRQLAVRLGIPEAKTLAIGNAVDCQRFQPVDRREARQRYGLDEADRVLVSVGWLIERKGFHRVIEVLPDLVRQHPRLRYLIVGGATGVDNMEAQLRRQVADLGLEDHVRFLGSMKPDDLKWPLSAADLFVLATRREGWANVFLEAMACGLPVVTTDVDGNPEVVCKPELGRIVPFGDGPALAEALRAGLSHDWDRGAIRAYAEENSWDNRIALLVRVFKEIHPSW